MTPQEYLDMVLKTYGPDMDDDVLFCMIGIAGEAGEIANMAQKCARGDFNGEDLRLVPKMSGNQCFNPAQRKKLIEEMGGVLYFMTALAHHLDTNLAKVMDINAKKLLSRLERGTIRGDGDDR